MIRPVVSCSMISNAIAQCNACASQPHLCVVFFNATDIPSEVEGKQGAVSLSTPRLDW